MRNATKQILALANKNGGDYPWRVPQISQNCPSQQTSKNQLIYSFVHVIPNDPTGAGPVGMGGGD